MCVWLVRSSVDRCGAVSNKADGCVVRLRLAVIAAKSGAVERRMQMSLYRTEVYRISIGSVVHHRAKMTTTTMMAIVEMCVCVPRTCAMKMMKTSECACTSAGGVFRRCEGVRETRVGGDGLQVNVRARGVVGHIGDVIVRQKEDAIAGEMWMC